MIVALDFCKFYDYTEYNIAIYNFQNKTYFDESSSPSLLLLCIAMLQSQCRGCSLVNEVDMKEIKLGRSGLVALVDGKDFRRVSKYHWCRLKGKYTNYAQSWVNGEKVRLHRFILGESDDPKMQVDHINRNGLDNRRCNLRFATKSQNMRNSRTVTSIEGKPTSSKFKGVTWNKDRRKWLAQAMKNYVNHYLGQFDIEIEAAQAYNKFAKENYGEFARLNEV